MAAELHRNRQPEANQSAHVLKQVNKWKEEGGHRDTPASHRGFSTRLSIREGFLFIEEVFILSNHDVPQLVSIPMMLLFNKDEPIKADWFSESLFEYLGEPYSVNTHLTSRARVFDFNAGKLVTVEIREQE